MNKLWNTLVIIAILLLINYQNASANPEIANLASETVKAANIPSIKAQDYKNLDMQNIADDVNGELEEERAGILIDLNVLWQAAAEKSETIRFAILKLSNPEGDKDKKSIVKKILSPLTSVAPLIGSGLSDPLAGGSALIGGGLLQSLLSDDSLANSYLSRVTDSDLVILAQEIDDLQQKLVNLYYNYSSAVERLNLMDTIVKNRYDLYQSAQNSSPETITVADVFYREAVDMQFKARREVLTSRAALEQFVGNDALIVVDKNIKDRNSKTNS